VDVSNPAEGWRLPGDLKGVVPREVHLTRAGIILSVVSLLIIAAAVEEFSWLWRDTRRKNAEIEQIILEGHQSQGFVTRVWETAGRGPRYHIAYRYSVNSLQYQSLPTDIDRSLWRSLAVGSPIAVSYRASDPGVNFPRKSPPYVPPPWFAIAVIGVTVLGSVAFVFAPIVGSRRYLVNGQPAPAVVTRVGKRAVGRPGASVTVEYQYCAMGSEACRGSYSTASMPPPEGSVICILFDPDHPSRNVPYPVKLASLLPVDLFEIHPHW
jgi:hypothetical protein